MVKNDSETKKKMVRKTPRKSAGSTDRVTERPRGFENWQEGPPPIQQRHTYHYPHRKLYRSKSNKWLGGVCGGLAKFFNTDPVLIRLLWVVITIASFGAGVIGYILFWLFVEKEPDSYSLDKKYVTSDEYGREHHHYHYKVSQ